MQFKLITPEKTLFEGEAAQATLPGTMGVFGVLPGHEHLISSLKSGIIIVEKTSGETEKFAVLEGVAEVKENEVAVLSEDAKALTGLSVEDAKTALETARSQLAMATTASEQAPLEHTVKMAETVLEGLAA